MCHPAWRGWLPAAILCLGMATQAGSSALHAPTPSWAGGQQGGEEFAHPRHYPVAHHDERYGPPRRQYSQYGSYAHRGLEVKTPQRLDYELEQPYQHEVNLYEYSYTESSTLGDQGTKYSRTGQRRPPGKDQATLSRSYGRRLWWTGVPLPVVGAHRESYMARTLGSDSQQGRSSGEIRRGASTRRLLHNESLVGAARVQKSLQQSGREAPLFGQDFPEVRTTPTTTIPPIHPRDRHPSGLESFLRLMTEDEHPSAAFGEVVPETPREEHGLSRSNRGRGWEGQADHRDGESAPAPVTATVVLGSIMLLIILVVVMVALRVQWRERVKGEEEWRVDSPTVQPPTPAPSNTTAPSPSSSSSHHLSPLDHLHPEPIRIKAKGLLERRGSNTSLTLELAAPGPPPDVVSPPRHCTPEEYLMTAGNRMSRRQLRQCLKEGRMLHAEFWEVPLNHPDKCDVPGSASKNRYRTVFPNEPTRVTLCSLDPADQYINANYVRGYDGQQRAYIVTQGPLTNTVVDLWRLVMQERSPAIVMITRLKEKQRVKCEPYVPSHTGTYGDITVSVRQVIVKSGYTIRQLSLQRGDERHDTLHFWYTAWPDHKAPSEADQLLAMALQVDHVRKQSIGGVIVHCSAGIGRSGCFVAISIAINQLLEEDAVDILGIVCQMRLDRGGMVQTGEQYEFIHRAVALYASSLPSPRQSKCYIRRQSITANPPSSSPSSFAATYMLPTPSSPDDSRSLLSCPPSPPPPPPPSSSPPPLHPY